MRKKTIIPLAFKRYGWMAGGGHETFRVELKNLSRGAGAGLKNFNL